MSFIYEISIENAIRYWFGAPAMSDRDVRRAVACMLGGVKENLVQNRVQAPSLNTLRKRWLTRFVIGP